MKQRTEEITKYSVISFMAMLLCAVYFDGFSLLFMGIVIGFLHRVNLDKRLVSLKLKPLMGRKKWW
jgi:hypothetical protein